MAKDHMEGEAWVSVTDEAIEALEQMIKTWRITARFDDAVYEIKAVKVTEGGTPRYHWERI